MKTANMTPDFLKQRIVSSSKSLKMINLIILISLIYSCASLNSTNYQSRIRAVNKVSDENVLYNVAINDLNFEVRIAAFNKISNQILINKLAIGVIDPNFLIVVIDKVSDQNILSFIALYYKNIDVKKVAFDKITNQNTINDLATQINEPNFDTLVINKVSDQDILFKIAVSDINLNGKVVAFNKLTSQYLINKVSNESKDRNIRKLAITKVTDQDILFELALNDINIDVKIAAFNKITDQNLINKLANQSKEPDLINLAINKVSDQNIIYNIALEDYYYSFKFTEGGKEYTHKMPSEDINYKIKDAAMNRLSPSLLAKLATDFQELKLKLKVIDLLRDQTELMNISQNNDNWDVRKSAFNKLNEYSLDILSREAKDPALALASKIRLGRISWYEAFSSKSSQNRSFGNVIGAAAIVENPLPSLSDVVSACHNFIKLGDTSRIPELIYLLNKFGNITLAEDYMNCGQNTLGDAGHVWCKAHGYLVQYGNYGSNRVRWGQKK